MGKGGKQGEDECRESRLYIRSQHVQAAILTNKAVLGGPLGVHLAGVGRRGGHPAHVPQQLPLGQGAGHEGMVHPATAPGVGHVGPEDGVRLREALRTTNSDGGGG